MAVFEGEDQKLQVSLKIVLIRVCAINDLLLKFVELCYNVYSRLLVPLGRVLEVCQSALELKRLIPVLNETRCDRGIERYAREALVSIAGSKDLVSFS